MPRGGCCAKRVPCGHATRWVLRVQLSVRPVTMTSSGLSAWLQSLRRRIFLTLALRGPASVTRTDKFLQGGKEVAHGGVVCTVTSLERNELQCVATAWFRGGQITGQALVGLEGGAFVVPITGGSGKYEGAEGELHVPSVSETKEILTFHLED
jgi:hypothetical protein